MKLFKKDNAGKAKKKKTDKGTAKNAGKGSDEGGSSDGKKKRSGGGGDGIKMLFANHIEKMLLGLAALIALLMVFKGFTSRTAIEGKAPNELQQQASQAETKVNNFSWGEFRTERDREKNFLERANETQQKIVENNYSIGQLIKPPMVPARTLRTDPVLLAPLDLRVIPGFGPLVTTNKAGGTATEARNPDAPVRDRRGEPWEKWVSANGDQTRGIYFNAITALVPYAKQLSEYEQLKNSGVYSETRDIPEYLGWALFREESIPGQPVKKKWISLRTLANAKDDWGGSGQNTLDPPIEFTDEVLTSPVPPILIGDLPRFAMHPGMPRDDADKADTFKEEAPVDTPPVTDEENPFGFSLRDKKEIPTEGEMSAEGETKVDGPPEFLLFRYFDTEVVPGRTYRYKLMLQMNDPNSPIEESARPSADTLDQSVAERLRKNDRHFRATPFSEPSDPVYVAEGSRILAGEVTAASTMSLGEGREIPRDEPSATIMATTFLPDSGANIPVVEQVYRGSVANYLRSAWYWPPKGREARYVENHPFKTDSTILDIRGGDPLAGTDLKAPGRLLVYDAKGRMLVVDELDDASMFESTRVPEPEAKDRRPGREDKRNGNENNGDDILGEGGRRGRR